MVLALVRRFVFGCWLSHVHLRRERREGVYTHVCDRCGCAWAILPGQVERMRSRLPKPRPKPQAVRRRA